MSLSACGGGGSSSGSGGNGSSSDPVPATAPTLPKTAYTGSTKSATISISDASGLAQNVFYGMSYAKSFTDFEIEGIPQVQAEINETDPGPKGGQVAILGRSSGNGGLWVQETYKDYEYTTYNGASHKIDEYTISGVVILEANIVGNDTVYTLGYSGYHAYGPDVDVVYDGTVVRSASNKLGSNGSQLILNLSILDNVDKLDEQFSNFTYTLASTNSSDQIYSPTTIQGRVYNQYMGYVDVATQGEEDIYAYPGASYPLTGADILVTDSSPNVFHIAPLNYYFFSAGIDLGGTGNVLEAARYSWNTLTPDTTPSSSGKVLAVAVQATEAFVGQPATVDGRFSHSPSGDFLTFQWKLRYAPPGSKAKLSVADSPTATFVPDIAGDYMLELDVADGANTSRDVVELTASTSTEKPKRLYGYKAGADQQGQVGVPVLLDGRSTALSFSTLGITAMNFNNGKPSYQWSLTTPPGSTATLNDTTTKSPTFTPDVPGYYKVRVKASDFYNADDGAAGNYADEETIAVGVDLLFDPPMNLLHTDGPLNYTDMLVVSDLNNDGLPDVVVADTYSNDLIGATGPTLQIFMDRSTGIYSAPTVIKLPTTPYGVAVGDLDGDGRADIAVSVAGGVIVVLQNTDGSWASPVTLSYGPSCTSSVGTIRIKALAGSSSNSLISSGGCSGGLEVWNYVGGTGFGSPSNVQVVSGSGSYIGSPVLADLTGDGIADAIGYGVCNSCSGIKDAEFLIPGKGDGSFGTPQVLSNNQVPFTVYDVDGDGNNDFVYVGSSGSTNNLSIYYGNGSGLATTPVTYATGSFPSGNPMIGDINGDGRTDILLLHSFSAAGALGIYEQKSDKTFAPEVFYPVSGSDVNSPQQTVWIADVNNDGIPDIVMFDSGISVYLGHK